MLKDSALAVLQVAKIAKKYNYNMKDCHGFNVLIENNKPKFIDLGSFHENSEGVTGWEPYREFLRFYYYPLCMWRDGFEYTSKLSIFSANLTPHTEHYIYKYRYLKNLNNNFLEKSIKARFSFSDIACKSSDMIYSKTRGKNFIFRNVIRYLKYFIDSSKITLSQNLDWLEKDVQKINRKEINSQWKNYHSKISKKKSRFEYIIKYVNEYCYDARTAIDVAGNQGLFSLKILKESSIEKVICQDLDEQAIDLGYKAHRNSNEYISYVNYNFIAPIVKTTHPLPSERFKSDVVFALALLHHLILSQGFSLDDILGELDKYSNKYVCIEFMPKGLWVHEDGDKVNVPSWYNLDWFREKFLRYFYILKEEQIAENYVVFLGEKKGSQ
ncbi:MAG: hypothetical protein A4E66_00346 [Syntrophus sp. PtaB.Bin001]|nr:MAG: hypothetical protein A4E66_00346 [Syntrophus sp. PtaB.Bin001]